MAKAITTSFLWSVICVQLAFFFILTALYLWKDYSDLEVSAIHQKGRDNRFNKPVSKLTPKSHQKRKQKLTRRKSHLNQTQLLRARHRQNRVPGKHLHTQNFNYTLNPASTACRNPVFLLVIVESSTYNAMERNYFRTRWKMNEYNKKKIATVFATAQSEIKGAQELLLWENKRHGDILQMDFRDSYRNLTLKTMLSLRWAIDECYSFTYLLKTDDDMIINYDVLINQLENLPDRVGEALYTGLMMTQKVPIRDSDDKWHVTFGEYPDDTYPDYMGGPGYVLSHLAAKKVVEYSYHIPFMPMEDVFVGICAEKAGIDGYSNLRFSNWEIWDYYNYCWAREMVTLHNADFAVRELYYYDKLINTHSFDFYSWGRKDLLQSLLFMQQKSNKLNEAAEFIGYPMRYRCSNSTWSLERTKCLYKHIVQWKIQNDRILDM
ncbi:beta-1,3-galactosyltransferase 5-like [Watersipora subatra]|uniref:beta-1,3-galactosyltransferase 5-like n=1 Tax=Watersipora subatra TaxID=2589382 RepID=UPI00355BBA4F